jgi:tRNA threonylcarbamoyladenosine biosynthesis protein TsaB
MIVLALDTAHETGSIALGYGSEIVEEVTLQAPDGFSGILFQEIGKLLERNKLRLDEVDVFAAASGPGSFTGVRVGLTAAKSLAAAQGKRSYGVSTLAAMANYGTGASRAVILDARRGEIYGAYGGMETVAPIGPWLTSLPGEVGEFLAFDFTPFDRAIAASRFAPTPRTVVPRAIASAIAELALEDFRVGLPGDPALVDANYVRRSDAELLWKDNR